MRRLRGVLYITALFGKLKNGMLMVMLKHLYLIIITTFIFGFISGIIIFLLTHTGIEGGGQPIEEFDSGVSVVARLYGGCQMAGDNCPSYRIANDGSYAYREPSRRLEPFRGELSTSEWRETKRRIQSEDFEAGYPPFTGTCPIAFDGSAYFYEITIDEVVYTVDSCVDTVSGNDLFERLKSYFVTFQNITLE